MWRMKVITVTVVVLGALMFGAMVAYAGWGWNAKVDIEGTKVSMSWAVTDDVSGAADYHAKITLTVPSGTDVNVIKVSPTEDVFVLPGGSCSGGMISGMVTYVVTSEVGDGSAVSVSVDQVGRGKTHYGHADGAVGDEISVDVNFPGNC